MKYFRNIVPLAIAVSLLSNCYADNKRQLDEPVSTPVGLNEVPDEAVVGYILPNLDPTSIRALELVNNKFCEAVDYYFVYNVAPEHTIYQACYEIVKHIDRIPGSSSSVPVNLSNLTSLDISHIKSLQSGSFEFLTNLISINLRHSKLKDSSGLRHLTNIEKMDLGHCKWVNDRTLWLLAELIKLTSINLDNTNVTDAGLEAFGPIKIQHVSLDKTMDVRKYKLRKLALLFNDLNKSNISSKAPITKDLGLFISAFNAYKPEIIQFLNKTIKSHRDTLDKNETYKKTDYRSKKQITQIFREPQS